MRKLLAVLACLFVLAGCGEATKPVAFKATDISGADFAKGFRLVDHTGAPRTLEDYRGKLVVLFFGFTQCPDVCPATLGEMAQVMSALGEDANRVQVLFASIDPERDTQQLLAQYVPAFHPTFVGLRGDAQATEQMIREYKLVVHKNKGKTPGSYTVDHSSGTFVYDAQGRVRLYMAHGTPASSMLEDLRTLLALKA